MGCLFAGASLALATLYIEQPGFYSEPSAYRRRSCGSEPADKDRSRLSCFVAFSQGSRDRQIGCDDRLRNPGAFVVRVRQRGRPSALVAGRFELQSAGQTPELGGLEVAAIPLAPTTIRNAETLVSKRDGSFALPITEGEWLVYVPSLQLRGYSVQSILYGATDLLKEPLELTGTSTAGEIRLMLQRAMTPLPK